MDLRSKIWIQNKVCSDPKHWIKKLRIFSEIGNFPLIITIEKILDQKVVFSMI